MQQIIQPIEAWAPSAWHARQKSPLAPRFTEAAGLIMLGTACIVMCLGLNVFSRAFLYVVSIALAIVGGGGLHPRIRLPACMFLLTGGLFILKAILNTPVPRLVVTDICNILLGFGILLTLRLSDMSWTFWQQFQLKAHRTVLSVAICGAVLGLAKLFYYNQGGIIPFIADPERGYPLGSSLRMDYNFYSLPLLLGILSAFWLLKNEPSARWSLAALLALPELSCAVLLSGSRRGFIAVACAVPILMLWLFITRQSQIGQRRGGISLKAMFAIPFLAGLICILNLTSLEEFVNQATSATSFSDVLSRWETFQNGTYSESRVHYWTTAAQRFKHFGPLDFLFGEGFAYVTELDADPEVSEDYPHNFLLSSLLYGGLLQTGCLLVMIVVALVRLSKSSQASGMFAAWLSLIVFFLMTSCNSFFSSEMAIILTVIALSVPRFDSGAQAQHASLARS